MDKKTISIDRVLFVLAECYVLLPIILFSWGWLEPVYAFMGTVLMIMLGIKIYCSSTLSFEDSSLLINNKLYWLCIAIVSFIWSYFSGIGGFSFQNGDFWVRNPIYRDLSTLSWPVVFDFSTQSERVQSLCGSSSAAFSYYFCWWLPPSFISKVLELGETGRNITILIWTFIGILLLVYLLCKKINRCIWFVPAILIFFSGLDVIPYLILNWSSNLLPWIKHIECWTVYFQYSSNTTQLYWVFNQSIPVWMLMALMIHLSDSRCNASLAAVSFAYSPWATFGMVPYAIYESVKGRKRFKEAFNCVNVGVVAFMMCIWGVFYLGGAGGSNTYSLVFLLHKGEELKVLVSYLVFISLEFGVYYIVMGKDAKDNQYYWVTLIELIVIPLFVVRDDNFVMRSSIPALFMTMYYVMNYFAQKKTLIEKENSYMLRKRILVVILCLGMITPLAEINRSLINTFTEEHYLEDQIYSFGNMDDVEDDWRIWVSRDQFFAYNYLKFPFFKYR